VSIDIGVAGHGRNFAIGGLNTRKALALGLASFFHPLADGGGRLAQAALVELFVVHRRNFDVDVNPVQQ